MEIPSEAFITFLKKTKPDSISEMYKYSLTTIDGDVFNFSLTWQKVIKLAEKEARERQHRQALIKAIDFRRPPSIYGGSISLQNLRLKVEEADRIEGYVERLKTERKEEDKKRQSTASDSKMPLYNGEELKRESFAIVDLGRFRTKEESKVAKKKIDKRSKFAKRKSSSLTYINARQIAKEIKEKQEKLSKKKKKRSARVKRKQL